MGFPGVLHSMKSFPYIPPLSGAELEKGGIDIHMDLFNVPPQPISSATSTNLSGSWLCQTSYRPDSGQNHMIKSWKDEDQKKKETRYLR